MGDTQRLWYYIIVATAGHDTTSFALAGGMEAMLRDPIADRRLQADPDLVVNGHRRGHPVDRPRPPLHAVRRRADQSIGGVDIPAGGRVLLSYPSANRDEEVFADSDALRRPPHRRRQAHLASALGAHFCLGAQFARREIRTMLSRLVPQLASIEKSGDAPLEPVPTSSAG